jgi:hypothetical protein
MLPRGVCQGDIFFKDFKSLFYLKNIKLIFLVYFFYNLNCWYKYFNVFSSEKYF